MTVLKLAKFMPKKVASQAKIDVLDFEAEKPKVLRISTEQIEIKRRIG
jgi:hypothetical protein